MRADFHEWLLSDEVDLLPRLLLPLAGPEEFEEDDMDKLPDDLQYLPPDKTREPASDIRCMLLEAIYQVGVKFNFLRTGVTKRPDTPHQDSRVPPH